ncbi:hypothetical protein Q8F55_001469 [Vanrija albida]|uniref:Xylanolytic transcriptional activator regulatory domain-containing protein n=1 Tax=Vanrija albida TaxID=181172 RepID=A0ABR3QG35_9TREE
MEERMRRVEDLLGLGPMHLKHEHDASGGPSASGSGSEKDMVVKSYRSPSGANFGASKYRLMMDNSGNIVYHGLTSLTHPETEGPEDDHRPTEVPGVTADGLGDPAFAPIFQALATSKHVSVSPEIGDALLEVHFCYSAPVFCVVTKQQFMRDMALGGPFFSEFLLMTIYASGTRMIDGLGAAERQAQGDLFIRLAREMLAKELAGSSKITTVQGLLLMSARECAVGNASQGWIYAGIAFRLLQDLGIHLPWENVPGSSRIPAEEKAARDRLFWSAFMWDKTISLAVGREPTFPLRNGLEPTRVPDFEDESRPWTPFYANPRNCPRTLVGYVYQPNYIVTSFRLHAKLSRVVHDIIVQLYNPETRLTSHQRIAFIAKTRPRLEKWWRQFPEDIKGPKEVSPPPWVYSVQMLYHASWILLYRPLIDEQELKAVEGHIVTCEEHSIVAHQLSASFNHTFKGKLSYLGMYCAFVSATFDIFTLKTERLDTQLSSLERLKSWLDILGTSALQGPSIKRSLHTIGEETYKHVSRDPILASSDAGQFIMSRHSAQTAAQVSPVSGFDGYGGYGQGGAIDFLELLGPTQM